MLESAAIAYPGMLARRMREAWGGDRWLHQGSMAKLGLGWEYA